MYTKIFAENDAFMERYNLVKKYIKSLASNGVKVGIDPEDLEADLVVKLFVISKEYDETRGAKFSTYAIKCLQNEYKEIVDSKFAKKRNNGKVDFSLNSPQNNDADRDFSLQDFIEAEGDNPFEVCWKKECISAVKEFFNHFGNEQIREIICLSYQGVNQNRIGQKYGIGQSLVSYYIKKFKTELREFLTHEGYID